MRLCLRIFLLVLLCRGVSSAESARDPLDGFDAFVSDVIKEIDTNVALKTAIETVAEERGRINSRRLGNYIQKHECRIERGLRFERGDKKQHSVMWRVRRQDAA